MKKFKYTHWLKIENDMEEKSWINCRYYKENYDYNMEVFGKDTSFICKYIKLECNQSYQSLDMDINSLSTGSLLHLSRKPKDVYKYNKPIEYFFERNIKKMPNILNPNEQKILETINDSDYMNLIGATPKDIEKTVIMAVNELKEVEGIITENQNNGINFEDLCRKLKGHNETLNQKYPEYNYFDLNYKSLLITIKQPLNKENKTLPMEIVKDNIIIYADNITKTNVDELIELDFNSKINFEKVCMELREQITEREEEL